MSKLNLTWRIALAVGIAVLTGVGASGTLVAQLQHTSTTYDAVLGQDEVQHQDRTRLMQVEFKKQVQEWKDLLIRGRKFEDFQKYKTAFKARETTVQTMAQALLKDVKDPEAHKQLQEFAAAHQKMGKSYDAAIEAFSATKGLDFSAADALVKGMDRAPTDAIDALVVRLQAVLVNVRETQKASVGSSIRQSVIIVAVMFMVIIGVVVFIIRSTRREMVELTIQLTHAAAGTASASGQVATSAQSLSQGATEQAASLEETSASMEEMASMTRKNAENSQTAAGLMGEVDTRVKESNQALSEMVSAMASIQSSSQQVAKIIKTIDEIAFQTNILALNAAVEAARAGEAGMGFAVVADEVRNLAQRSAQAAKDTAELIEASIAKAEDGNHKVEQVAASISGITGSITSVKGLVEEVSVASRQQSQGIDQVSQAIAQMEKVTQTTAATAEESAAASEELSAQAEDSMAVIRQLEALVGSSGVQTAKPAGKKTAARKPAPVVRMPAPRAARGSRPAPADELPMGDTGTYGRF
jgi:methyl-accepting chemotaxis protein